MLARESHALHATPWQNIRRMCFQLNIMFSMFYVMPTWCDISVCLCMWYLCVCVCAHWCGCSSLHMHVWRTDVYVKSFPLLFSFSFFFSAFEVGSPDWTLNSWFLLSWLTKKLQRFIYLYAPSIGIISKHWNIWLFCLRWVYKLKNSCLHSMYFNPYNNFPSSLCDDLLPTLILILIQRYFLNHTMYLYAWFHCSLNINSTHPATLHYKPL